jgi:rod shape-determining protein MreC
MIDRRRRVRAPNPFGGPLTVATMVAMGVVAVGLLVFAPGADWVRHVRTVADDVVNPAQQVVAAPFEAIRSIGSRGADHMRIVEENRRLREENERLRAWYEVALAMRDKMDRYEEILSLNPDPSAEVVVARVVAETDGPFVKTRILNAGTREGVAVDQGVMSEHGLVGRVVSAGERSSRVLLLKDLNSRIPVLAERNDARAILAGDNSDRPQLRYLRAGHGLISGDRIVTSGDGGLLPRGLPVGEAFLDDQGQWRVRLYSDEGPVDYVRVVKFEFPHDADAPASDEAAPSESTAGALAARIGEGAG